MTAVNAKSGSESAGGRVVVLLVLGLVVIFGGAYAGARWYADDKLPVDTTIAGVDVGGLTPEQAEATLADGLADHQAAQIEVAVGGDTLRLSPGQAGLAVDYAASVAQVRDRATWEPEGLWDYYTRGDEYEPVVTLDSAKMSLLTARIASATGIPPVNGRVGFSDGHVDVVEARLGQGIEPTEARSAIAAAYLTDGSRAVVPLRPIVGDIDANDVQKALNTFANPAVAGPVTLRFGRTSVRLDPREYTGVLAMVAKDGRLVPKVKNAALARVLGSELRERGAPVNATVRLVDGRPRVIPSRPGVGFKAADAAAAFLAAVTEKGPKRVHPVKITLKQPAFTTAEARKLGVTKPVSTFTTYFPHADYRNTNIGRAADLVNGKLLMPGDTFSLNDTVGERTVANGFTVGYVISDGIFTQELGGGVSQLATTFFNAAFFAGLKDVEHHTHSFYIDRYPAGREATVAWGSLDLRFTNDLPYGVLVQAGVTPSTPTSAGVVTVTLWSTPYWDISTRTSARYDFTHPKTRVLSGRDCYPNAGYDGFQVDVRRYFRRIGSSAVDRVERLHTTYLPSDTVVCKPR